jgi:hypothetical protein
MFSEEILDVEISSNVTLRYPTASDDTLIVSPVKVEKNPSPIINVEILEVDTNSSLTVSEERTIEEPKMGDPIIVENRTVDTEMEDPTSVEKKPLFKFNVETPIVETSSLFTVREDRTMEDPLIEDPVIVEN